MKWFYVSYLKAHTQAACAIVAVAVLAQPALAATIAPASVTAATQTGTAQDVIVVFNTTKIAHAVRTLRAAAEADDDEDKHGKDKHGKDKHDDAKHDADKSDADKDDADEVDRDEIRTFKVKQYRKIKSRALRAIGKAGITTQLDYTHLPMVLVRVENGDALQRLVSSTDVVGVYENAVHQHALVESLPYISQPSAQLAGKTGAGTTVAVLDTGVNYTLAEFGSCSSPGVPLGCRVPFAQDFAPSDSVLDDNGHGTNVAAIVAAVAPGTRIVALDVFNGGNGFAADIIAAINWTIANQAAYNIVAMNLSLGDGSDNAAECPGAWATIAFAGARSAGIIPVVAAGNNGFANGVNGPACTPGAVRVGAIYDSEMGLRAWSGICTDSVTAADRVVCFSNSAGTLTLLAPGSIINAGGYSNSGTSQAAPHVAGAVAVLRAANAFPAETLDQTVARMQNTGDLISDPKNGRVTPRLNLGRAVLP